MTPEKIAEFAGNVRTRDQVEEAIKLAVADEREACARLVELYISRGSFHDLPEAIRART